MDIERVNEHTVKLYMTFRDIEERGLDRDDIWQNREKSEELFWDMLDEINLYDEFIVDGPLWIQVQILDKGIEILVTQAQMSKDGKKIELPIELDKKNEIQSLLELEEEVIEVEKELEQNDDGYIEFFVRFKDFEDVISLAHRIDATSIETSLFTYKNTYYVYFLFDEMTMTEEEIDMMISYITEYGDESRNTVHWVEEYGKKILESDALIQMKEHFPMK